jgi:hypothetical protein
MHIRLAFMLALLAAHGVVMAEPEDSISSDRPDFVDSSDVVGKGVVQLEAGFAQDRNRDAGLRERTSSTPLLLRIGVADDLELRVETDGRMRYRADGTDYARERGYGDSALSVKWHVRDGDGAIPSVGIIGQLDFATGSQAFRGEGTRPSVRITGEWDLAPGWSLGVMPGVMDDRDERGRHFASGMLGASLDKEWSDRLHSFLELASQRIARAHNGGTTASFDFGATYLLTKNLQIDAALSRGLNHRTPDYSFTFGLSARL